MTENNIPTPAEKTSFWKSPLFRKATLIVGATAGVVIATAVLTKKNVEQDTEEDQDVVLAEVVEFPTKETAS